MSNELTIAWMTTRKDACWQWFCDSLHRETNGNYDGIDVMAIDYWANPFGGTPEFHEERQAYILAGLRCYGDQFVWAAPKPTPWQGIYRQTKEDWFAASSARNTAIALCKTKWICYVDDLSVLMPGWLNEVFLGMREEKTITCGAYRKALNMTVVDGELVGFEPNVVEGVDRGLDSRLTRVKGEDAVPVSGGSWMYGCSVLAPVEAFLSVNGWDERCDGLGSEDSITGINLSKKGWHFRYAPKMMTYESEERHHVEGQFKRSDYGVSPNDKSHAILKMAQDGNGWSPVSFGGVNLTRLCEKVKNHQAFPAPPNHVMDWYTKKLLSEL